MINSKDAEIAINYKELKRAQVLQNLEKKRTKSNGKRGKIKINAIGSKTTWTDSN